MHRLNSLYVTKRYLLCPFIKSSDQSCKSYHIDDMINLLNSFELLLLPNVIFKYFEIPSVDSDKRAQGPVFEL